MHHRVIVLVLLVLGSLRAVVAQERFDSMQVGSATYTNVFVLSKTHADLFFTHSLGLANVKVKELDQDLRIQLGYEEDVYSENRRRTEFKVKPIEMDPRVKEWQTKFSKDFETKLQSTARNIVIGILVGVALIYLFFCYCCMQICEKAGAPAPFLVWIPGLQLVPLFKAAGLPRWSVSALFAPQIFSGMTPYLLPEDLSLGSPKMITFLALAGVSILISIATAIIWAVKICKARNKNPWLAAFLLFPLTSVFTFVYLAMSNGEEEVVMGNPGFVSFH